MFGFLNTVILSAIGLALIPLLIHLLNRKKPQPVAFSSLRFLKMLQQRQIRNLKIRQWILLILRTIILLLLVLAFARPTWRSSSRPPVQFHERTSVILILDHSLSTSARTAEGIVFDRLQSKALDLMRFLGEDDEILLLTAPGSDDDVHAVFTSQFSDIQSRIRRLKPVWTESHIRDQMELALQLMRKARHPNREIIVFSDMQVSDLDHGWPLDTVQSSNDPEPYWLFVDASPKEIQNIYPDTVRLLTQLIEKGRPVQMQVRLMNSLPRAIEDFNLQLSFNGKKVQQQTITLSSEETTEINLSAVPLTAGFNEAVIETDDDALPGDNRYYFHFFVPEQIRTVLMHSGTPSARYIELALRPDPQFRTPISLRSLRTSQWNTVQWDSVDVAIVYDLSGLDERQLQTLEQLLQTGKGVMIIPGPSSDPVNMEKIFNRFQLGRILRISDFTGRSDAYATLGEMNLTHALLKGVFEKPMLDRLKQSESPRIDKYLTIESGGRGNPLIRLNNGDAFLTEYRVAKGRLMFLATAPDLQWNDLPLHSFFPPLLHRSVLYLYAPPETGQTQLICGKSAELRLNTSDWGSITITGDEGIELKPVVKSIGNEMYLRVPRISAPGHYRITSRNHTLQCLSVNVPTSESRLQYLTKDDLEKMMAGRAFEKIKAEESLEEYVLISRYGYELWKSILILALILMILETALAQSHRLEKK